MNKISFKIQTVVFLLIAGCSSVPVSEEAITKSTQNERTISVLNNLIQVDIDTYHTYAQAIQTLNSQKSSVQEEEFPQNFQGILKDT